MARVSHRRVLGLLLDQLALGRGPALHCQCSQRALPLGGASYASWISIFHWCFGKVKSKGTKKLQVGTSTHRLKFLGSAIGKLGASAACCVHFYLFKSDTDTTPTIQPRKMKDNSITGHFSGGCLFFQKSW